MAETPSLRPPSSALLILGSASPRRREILENLGISFVLATAAVDETVLANEEVNAYLPRVAQAKLDAVRGTLAPELAARARFVLVADTSVVADGILGKPSDREDAARMIAHLAGKTHEVQTRFVLAPPDPTSPVAHAETVITRVTFRDLSPREIEAYAEHGEGMDKAGGYAVQGRAAAFVSRIEGSYANVVGLPACELSVALARLGFS